MAVGPVTGGGGGGGGPSPNLPTADEKAALDQSPNTLMAGNPVVSFDDLVPKVVHTSPMGNGYAGALVFDDTATTGGLYAWGGLTNDYIKIGRAIS